MNEPERLTVPSDEKERAKKLEKDPKLKAAVEGKEFVPVKAEDFGVEAIDDYTFRIKLYQPAPFFLGLLRASIFPRPASGNHRKIRQRLGQTGKYRDQRTRLKSKSHHPYDELIVVKDPNYWDAANVKLDGIEFYPLEEADDDDESL